MTGQVSLALSSLRRRFTVNRKAVSTGAAGARSIGNSPTYAGGDGLSGVEIAPPLSFLRLLSLSIQPRSPFKTVPCEGAFHTIHIANEVVRGMSEECVGLRLFGRLRRHASGGPPGAKGLPPSGLPILQRAM